MNGYPAVFASPAYFPHPLYGASPFVAPTPLVPISGLVATPAATSAALHSPWALGPQQLPATYTPAQPAHTLPPDSSPGGIIPWQPYPYPHPAMSAPAFSSIPAMMSPHVSLTPLTPGQSLALSGGYPPPGMQPSWTPMDSWPPSERSLPLHLAPWLVPNPFNADRPHVVWDISEPPSQAKRISGKDVFVDMHDAFESKATAVFPEADEIIVVCHTGLAQDMWPPIRIRKDCVTSGDVFWAIYNFFQTTVTRTEVDRIAAHSEDTLNRLLDACYRRCRRAGGLADITRRQGVKRIDCLEGRTAWWGMWAVWALDGTYSLHLGLTPSDRA
ncbi:hypothetical protein BC834DRAFT_829663 [Gloeopeniophorella convolvens]|nr:hypothetical protein BC834DRAFT_829663 [Gloeopeniophorella convolvens]